MCEPLEIPEAPTTAPGTFRTPIMDDEDAHRADLMDVMTNRDLCRYFKRSPNATRRIVRELGIRPTPWTKDQRRKTYFRRDLYAAIQGAGTKSKRRGAR